MLFLQWCPRADLHVVISYKAVDVSGVAEDLMLMKRENQALTSELIVMEDKMS